jgi:hypothetical protein
MGTGQPNHIFMAVGKRRLRLGCCMLGGVDGWLSGGSTDSKRHYSISVSHIDFLEIIV